MIIRKKDLQARMRCLEELARLLSIEEGLFEDCDTPIDLSISANERHEYRAALHDAVRCLGRARITLASGLWLVLLVHPLSI
jgi:hypothetical protein